VPNIFKDGSFRILESSGHLQGIFLGDKSGRRVRLTNVAPKCAEYLERWELQHPGIFRASPGL